MTWQHRQNVCVPSVDSDQSGHPPSLICVFTVHMKKVLVLRYPLSAQRRLWSDWEDAQADLSLPWAHTHFVGFVMSQLIFKYVWNQTPFIPPYPEWKLSGTQPYWIKMIWVVSCQNQHNGMCAQQRQISLGICRVWSGSPLSAWRKLGSLPTHWVHREHSHQTGWMPRLTCLRWAHSHFVGFVVLWLICIKLRLL